MLNLDCSLPDYQNKMNLPGNSGAIPEEIYSFFFLNLITSEVFDDAHAYSLFQGFQLHQVYTLPIITKRKVPDTEF